MKQVAVIRLIKQLLRRWSKVKIIVEYALYAAGAEVRKVWEGIK